MLYETPLYKLRNKYRWSLKWINKYISYTNMTATRNIQTKIYFIPIWTLSRWSSHLLLYTNCLYIWNIHIWHVKWNCLRFDKKIAISNTHIYRYIWLYLCFEVRLLRWWNVGDVDFVQVEYANNQNILKAHDYQYKIYFTWIPNGFSTLRRVNHLWKLSIISYSYSFIGTTQRAIEYSR